MTPKAFAIGARCEHPQELIDSVQLGEIRHKNGVEPAEYFLSCQLGSKGLYSFCMCPGGFIIPTPTETGHLNVNGMSNSNRGGRFANAALVVTVEPEDFFHRDTRRSGFSRCSCGTCIPTALGKQHSRRVEVGTMHRPNG